MSDQTDLAQDGSLRAVEGRTRRRFKILFAVWTAVALTALAWNIQNIQNHIVSFATSEAMATLDKDLLYRQWASAHGGVYAPVTEQTPANPYLKGLVAEQNITTPSGKQLTLINPAYMTRQVFELQQEKKRTRGHITSLTPLNPGNTPDPWETEILTRFQTNPTAASAVVDIDNEPFLRWMVPMITEASCLKCHASQGYIEGDIRGGLSVSIPLAPYQLEARLAIVPIIGGHLLIWFLGATGLILGRRYSLRQDRKSYDSQTMFRQYKHILSSTPDLLALLSPQYIYLAANDAYLVAVNKTRDELIGSSASDVFGEEFFQNMIQPHAEKCFSGQEARWQHWMDMPEGEPCYLDITYSPHRSETEEVIGVVISARDITDTERMKDTIRQIVEASSRQYGESYFSAVALKLASTLNADYILIGETQKTKEPSVRTLAAVSDGKEIPQFEYSLKGTPCQNIINDSMCFHSTDVSKEFPKDTLLQEMNVHGYIGVPLFDSQGAVLGIMLALFKATDAPHQLANSILQIFSAQVGSEIERLKSEEQLRQRDHRYSLMLESTMDGFVLVSNKGRIIDVNNAYCKMSGYSRQEILSMGLTDIDTIESAIETEEHIRYITKHGYDRFETQHLRKDGTTFHVEVSSSYSPENNGQFLAFFRDITEQKSLAEQLRHAQKMEAFGQLAGGVAHDFNNILQVILGFGEIADSLVAPGSTTHAAINQIMESSHRAKDLVSQLLTFSRKQTLSLEALSLDETMRDFSDMISRVIGEHIAFSLHIEPDTHRIWADNSQIHQILMNLCVNAKDAMPTGGEITVLVQNEKLDQAYCKQHPEVTQGDYVLLSVSDTGCGMDHSTQERIFEPFFSTKEIGKGTGLGLATVYGIVQQHHGIVSVNSSPEEGTEFKIYFPAHKDEGTSRSLKNTPNPKGGAELILLAEDDEVLRQLGIVTLESAGYTVLAAKDGEEAIKLFNAHAQQISLVILDVIMPKLSGRAVYDHIHQQQPETKIIFSSGYSASTLETDFLATSGVPLLQKPYKKTALLHLIRSMLDS